MSLLGVRFLDKAVHKGAKKRRKLHFWKGSGSDVVSENVMVGCCSVSPTTFISLPLVSLEKNRALRNGRTYPCANSTLFKALYEALYKAPRTVFIDLPSDNVCVA